MNVFSNFLPTLVCLLFLNSACVYSQVSSFKADLTQQESMLVSWTMKAGITCIDLELQHAGPDLNFQSVYLHNGICGSTDKEESYSYEHIDGISTTNFYRIKLGFIGYSDTIKIDAPLLGSNGIIVSPQPASSYFQFQFNNPKSDKFDLALFNLSGNLILRKSGITSNAFSVISIEIPAGYYIFDLRSNYQSHQGKICITH
jgi:hypothetical protein